MQILVLVNRGQVDSEALGYFADFAIWNAALTNEEIWRVMKGESPLRVRPGNLRGYWPLNDYETTLANAGNARDHAWNNNLLMWSGGANIALSSKNPHRHTTSGLTVCLSILLLMVAKLFLPPFHIKWKF